MERIAILIGLLIGGVMGLAIVHAVSKPPSELEAMSAVIGATLGAVGGYIVASMAKAADRMEETLKPARVFRPQVAGASCVECGQRILLISDGVACSDCERIICQPCVSQHPCTAPIVASIVDQEPSDT